MHKETDPTLFWHILLPHNRNACNESTKVYCIKSAHQHKSVARF